MPDVVDWLNAITLKSINPKAAEDLAFRNAALLAHVRANGFEPYEGGVSMDEAFLYGPMEGGAYAKGETFSTNVVEPIGGQSFTPRQYEVGISDYLENFAINRGKAAVYNGLRLRMKSAINTINTQMNIALYRHGQASATNITDSRTKHVNGIAEALNDGVTQSWDGNIFATYGGVTRGTTVGAGYNSIPRFAGDTSNGELGQLTYELLLNSYLEASKGNRRPKLGLTSKAAFGFALQRVQAHQQAQFKMGEDAVWGAEGIKFMGATILVDEYSPSTIDGVNDAKLGNYLTSTFTIAGTPAAKSKLPSSGTVKVGETFTWINPETWKFRLSSQKPFDFGFTGFKPAQDSTKIAGQVLAMGNFYCTAPWLNQMIFGIGS